MLPSPVLHVTDDNVYFGKIALHRTDTSIYSDQNLLILRDQMSTLQSLAQCVQMNWMSILVRTTNLYIIVHFFLSLILIIIFFTSFIGRRIGMWKKQCCSCFSSDGRSKSEVSCCQLCYGYNRDTRWF